MVVVTLLFHAEFGLNDHREDAPHFRKNIGEVQRLVPFSNFKTDKII